MSAKELDFVVSKVCIAAIVICTILFVIFS